MNMKSLFACLSILLLLACGGEDKMVKVRELTAAGKLGDAKRLYQEHVEAEANPNIERDYIRWLYEHKQYQDFRNAIRSFLARYPNDTEVKQLRYDYYATYVSEQERAKNYGEAYEKLVKHLLDTDFQDYKKWEARQTSILRKWYQTAEEKEDESEMRMVILNMVNHGFDNLAESMNEEMYKQVKAFD